MSEENGFAKDFSEDGFWNKVVKYAKAAGQEVIEKALWLYYAAQNPQTPTWAKATIYGALGEDDLPLRTAKSWDRSGNVIHCGSLHKTLAPGMRIGWMLGGRWLARIKMLKHAQSRANDALAQLAIAEFMGSHA